jgi:hypothetical protein
VQITFDLPADAAKRLSQLADGDEQALLRELGIISFQVQGDKVTILLESRISKISKSQNSCGKQTN